MLTMLSLAIALNCGILDLQELERFEFGRVAFGGELRVVVYAQEETRAVEAVRAAFGRVEELDWALSDWREDGVLAELAREAGGEWLDLPRDLARCLMVAMPVAARSDGGFDPTAAPLTHLWRRARAQGRWPGAAEVARARERVGHLGLELHTRLEAGADPAEAPRARLLHPGMGLDLGGVAKGYAADELLAVLVEHGLERALVDVGGDLALGAPPPDAAGWRVRAGHGEGARLLELAHVGVATSGPQEQHLDAHGRRWSHLIDPRTGYGVTDGRTVTVIAPSAALADAVASAAAVLSPAEAEALLPHFPGLRLIQQYPESRALLSEDGLTGWRGIGEGADWSVAADRISGRGGWLVSEAGYSAFELEFRYRTEGDARLLVAARVAEVSPDPTGLHLWLAPADPTAGDRSLPTRAVTGLRADPGPTADTWRHVRVRLTGFDPELTVWVDDEEVSSARMGPGSGPRLPHGPLAFGLTGSGAVHLADLHLCELPVLGRGFSAERPLDPEAFEHGLRELTAAGRETGWRELAPAGLADFEAHGDETGYRFENGVLTIPARGWGHLATREDHRDFELSFEFELAPGANSGLFLRAARDGSNPATSGAEIQLIDDEGWQRFTGHALTPTQRTGALYAAVGVPAPPEKLLRPVGQWNRLEVLQRGSRLAVALEGVVLYDVDTHELASDPPFARRAPTGFLGFQRYGAPAVPEDQPSVRLRNLFLRPN